VAPPDLDKEEWQSLLEQLPTVKALFESQGKIPGKLIQQFPLDVQEGIKVAVSKATTSEEKRNLLFGWYHRAQWARDAFAGGVSKEELDRFFREDLNDKEREDLLSKAPEDFNKSLRFLYHVKKELPPGHLRRFAKRGGWGRGGKGGGRSPDEGFGPGRGGGPPPEFDRDHRDRRDREDRRGHGSDSERRRRPDDDKPKDSAERNEPSPGGTP
jgi:hypothetical protein